MYWQSRVARIAESILKLLIDLPININSKIQLLKWLNVVIAD
jgi:hypothetical protein